MAMTRCEIRLDEKQLNKETMDYINIWNTRGQIGNLNMQLHISKHNYPEVERRLKDALDLKLIDYVEYLRVTDIVEQFKSLI